MARPSGTLSEDARGKSYWKSGKSYDGTDTGAAYFSNVRLTSEPTTANPIKREYHWEPRTVELQWKERTD